jgi:hypothetical protein
VQYDCSMVGCGGCLGGRVDRWVGGRELAGYVSRDGDRGWGSGLVAGELGRRFWGTLTFGVGVAGAGSTLCSECRSAAEAPSVLVHVKQRT